MKINTKQIDQFRGYLGFNATSYMAELELFDKLQSEQAFYFIRLSDSCGYAAFDKPHEN